MDESAPADPKALTAEQVLAELVACKDLKDKAEAYALSWNMTGCDGRRMPFYEDSMREYLRRKPLAWEAARALAAREQSAAVSEPTK
jgi:hypothetical protein